MNTPIGSHTALLILDLQKGVVRHDTMHPVTDIIAQAARLAECFRAAALPVVIINVNPLGAAWTRTRVEQPVIPQNMVVQALAQAAIPLFGFMEIVPELGLKESDLLLTKKTWSAFYQTPLHQELQQRHITQLVLCGLSTSIAIEGTARSASEMGYHLLFATDAMTDRIATAHEHSISRVFPLLGELTTTEALITAMF